LRKVKLSKRTAFTFTCAKIAIDRTTTANAIIGTSGKRDYLQGVVAKGW